MSKKQKTARRRPQPKRASTALVRRPTTRVIVRDPHRLLPTQTTETTVGGEGMLIGALGKATFKLTKAQTKILMRPVKVEDVRIKPTGQVYLPHGRYTSWFNEAFSIGQWSIVPAGKPSTAGRSVNVPYILYVNGTPAAFAMGEQEYFESNAQQTLGDAIESTVASGLRRCAKRLGVSLELWDRQWADNFVATYGVAVKVKRGKDTVTMWRLKTDRPLRGEIGSMRQEDHVGDVYEAEEVRDVSQDRRQGDRRERAGTHAKERDKITEAQVGRLYAIAKSVGRSRAEVEIWLHQVKGYESAADIKRNEYDEICQVIERRGPLGGA